VTPSSAPPNARFYGDLARWWPLISPVEDYADEAAEFSRILRTTLPGAHTVLELGSGGGHNAAHLKRHFQMTLSDLNAPMLEVSKRLNPECDHVQGDMRTIRLGRAFDAVFVHDAISYMTSEDDLAAVMATAFAHCRPGGIALFVPDETTETFAPSTECGGSDGPNGEAIRFLEWSYDPDPSDTSVTTVYSFLYREADGTQGSATETHLGGLFPRATWLRLIEAQGFAASVVTERNEDDRDPRLIFIGQA
jgi:SAM-dependent methyltransferase